MSYRIISYLKRLRQIQHRHLLCHHVTTNVVAALVLTRLDYCNALLAGLPYSTVAPLQRVINTSAWLVCGLRPRDHVTDATTELQWLLIRAWIQYKLCLLVHRTINGQSPNYIAELPYSLSPQDTQSADKNTLLVPQTSLKFWGVGI